jgi:hypothetical protein
MVRLLMLSAVKGVAKERATTEAPGLVRLVDFDLMAAVVGVDDERLWQR